MAEKKQFDVHEVAAEVNRHPNTIRNFIKRRLVEPRRQWNGWAVFEQKDIDKIKKLTCQD